MSFSDGQAVGSVRAAIDLDKLNAFFDKTVKQKVKTPVSVKQFKVCMTPL